MVIFRQRNVRLSSMMNWAQKRLKIWGLIGGIMLIPCHPAMGQCTISNILKGDFRGPSEGTVKRPWYAEGEAKGKYGWILTPFPSFAYGSAAQFDFADGSARFDARFDNITGWKALHQSVSLLANKGYELTAVVRTSPNMREGYLGFRGAGLPKQPKQTQFGPQAGFKMARYVRPGSGRQLRCFRRLLGTRQRGLYRSG